MWQKVVEISALGTCIGTLVLIVQNVKQPASIPQRLLVTFFLIVVVLLLGFWNYKTLRLRLRGKTFKITTVCLNHRTNAKVKYYNAAFSSGKDVLYLSVMSQATLKSMKPHLDMCVRSDTKLRVLTWDEHIPAAVVEAYRLHLNENSDHPDRSLEQARRAAQDWKALQNDYKDNLQVRDYRSIPTMQGLVVEDSWALIELIPFSAQPEERPALLLTPKSDPELFSFFRQKFEDLWKANG